MKRLLGLLLALPLCAHSIVKNQPPASGGAGMVSSVAFLDGSSTPVFNISGSPVTTTGTLTETLKTQAANFVFGGPTSGAAAQPAFRALVAADISGIGGLTLGASSLTSAVINVPNSSGTTLLNPQFTSSYNGFTNNSIGFGVGLQSATRVTNAECRTTEGAGGGNYFTTIFEITGAADVRWCGSEGNDYFELQFQNSGAGVVGGLMIANDANVAPGVADGPALYVTSNTGGGCATNYGVDIPASVTISTPCSLFDTDHSGNGYGMLYVSDGATGVGFVIDNLEWHAIGNTTPVVFEKATSTGTSQVTLTLGDTNAASVTNIVGGSAANTQVNGKPIGAGLSIPTGTATFAVGTGVTSVVCASGFSCNNTRGTLTIVGGTATTGTIATVSFSAALSAAPACFAWMNGGTTFFGIGNSAPTTTAFNITAAISVLGVTFNVNYTCQP